MPYISPKKRLEFDETITALCPNSTGELNYLFTRLLVHYIRRQGLNYATLSQAMAALSDCRDEFYRRKVVPYEESKRLENGDVYD